MKILIYCLGMVDLHACLLAAWCACARLCAHTHTTCVHVHIYLSVFSYISTLLSPKSPILMSCHWQLLPTPALTLLDGRGQSGLLCVSAHIGTRERRLLKKERKKHETGCSLLPKRWTKLTFVCLYCLQPKKKKKIVDAIVANLSLCC